MIITIGFTETDRMFALYGHRDDNTYVPSQDGYRPGAAQDLVAFEVADAEELSPEQWAEAVWVVTNAPAFTVLDGYAGASQVLRALTRVEGFGDLRAVSVGDTVDVDGRLWVCEKSGWTFVEDLATA